jgi:hypothetical protein
MTPSFTFPSPRVSAPRRPPWLLGLVLALAAAAAGVGWLVWDTTRPGRSLRALPAAERQAVYQHTMDDLRTLCGPDHPAALQDHCAALAATVAPLDECDAECEALIRPILTPLPTR